jgi:DNA-binding CsgD family transcriptional regulator
VIVIVPVGFYQVKKEKKYGWDWLTPREREVALLVGQGYINREIGVELGIALGTVKTNVRRAAAKMGVRGKEALGDVVMGITKNGCN